METSAAITGSAPGLPFSMHLPRRHAAVLAVAVSAALPVLPISTIVRSDPYRTMRVPRALTRRRRRTRRRSLTDADDGDGDGFFYGSGDDGPFGGGGGGGGGRGWNPDGFGDHEEEEGWGAWGSSDPAFDVVCEVLSWVALSNCVVFAWKRILTDREKAVPARLVQAIC